MATGEGAATRQDLVAHAPTYFTSYLYSTPLLVRFLKESWSFSLFAEKGVNKTDDNT